MLKKRTRRSKTKKPKEITLFYSNVNGLKSKQESLKQIVANLSPKIIALCETKLPSENILKKLLPGYEINSKPTKSGQSGIAIAVKTQTFNSVLDVTSSTHNGIIATRIEVDHRAFRVILGYGPQESDPVEVREHFFTELEIELTESKTAGDLPLIIGDMNSKVEQVDGQIVPMSGNGKLLKELAENQELEILNFDKRCQGKWTHVVRTTKAMSVLDYVLADCNISKNIEKMIIDEECLFCPFAAKKKKKLITAQYSDHNSIITTLVLPYSKKKGGEHQSWRLTEEGLHKFHALTCEETFPIDVDGEGQIKYDNFEKLLRSTMDNCFRKSKPRRDQQFNKKYTTMYKKLMSFAKKGKAQRKVARTYVEAIKKSNVEEVAQKNSQNIRNTLSNITVDNSFSPNNFWELCKRNRCSKNGMTTSVVTENGNEVYGEEMIKNTYVKEFQHRLRERDIAPELKNYENRTKLLCKLLLERSKSVKVPNYTEAEIDTATKKIKKKKSCGRDKIPPEVPINWGCQLKKLCVNVMNSIKHTQEIPNQWIDVLVTTLFKNKGSRKMLVNHRGIFLKQILSKLFERINNNRIESNVQKIDPSQAGCRKNRSPADQTFLLRGAIDHAKYMNKPLYIVLYDYTQCFDSLWLEDCLLSLWNIGIQNEILNLIKLMNEQCNIVLKTPAGCTEEFTVENIVQQGSVTGGILCASSTGEVASEIKYGGMQIGTSTLKVLTYVDDIATINTNTGDVYYSHERVSWFSKRKRLELSVGKCVLLCVNLKKSDVVPQLNIDNIPVPVKDVTTYLGDQFNSKGTNTDLVEERVKKGKACIVNSMALCSDVTMGIHAVETLLLLYYCLFLAVFLYNAQAWSNLTKTDLMSLQRVQIKFIKRMFHAPSSSSTPLTYLETGILPIEFEINIKQLCFLHHILTLPSDDPVHHTYMQQLMYQAPNWGNEIKHLRKKYDLQETDEEVASLSKEEWKRLVKRKVRAKALDKLNDEAEGQKNSSNLPRYENLQRQEYISTLTPKKARKIFHIRTNTIDLKAVRKYKYGNDTMCRLCSQEPETIEHVVNDCTAIDRTCLIDNVFTINCEELDEIAKRCIEFDNKVDALKQSVSCTTNGEP